MKGHTLFVVGLFISVIASANIKPFELTGSDKEKGQTIALEIDQRDVGFKDYIVDAEMILMQDGKVLSVREFHQKVLEVEGEGDHSVNVFNSPRDVAGTAVLVHSHGLKPDDQWVYLPAIKRVKRISTRSKSGPFVGSEFAYEDITTWLPEKYNHRYIQDENVDGQPCYKLEEIPAYADSGYSKLLQWIDQEIFLPRKIEYYDRKGELLKTLNIYDYKEYGGYWRPSKMVMKNNQSGRSTELLWREYQFATGLTASDIAKGKLRRLR